MTTHQVTFLLLDLALIIVLGRLLGGLASRIGQPPVIGEVIAGILIGPTLFGGGLTAALFPVDTRPFLSALANVSIAMFMFLVGLELDRTLLRKRGRIAITVSISSIALPFAFGAFLAVYLARTHASGAHPGFVLFMGAAMSVTAFPVLARILTDRGMHRTMLGSVALTCAAIDDVLAWSLLAVVVTLSGGGHQNWMVLLFLPYVATMLWGVRPLLRKLIPAGTQLGPGLLAATMAGVLISGAITEWIGLHFLFGAFLVGVVVPRDRTERLRAELLDRVGSFNSALLLPVFFIVAGLKVDLSAFNVVWAGELALILLAAIGGKFIGAYAGARVHGLPARESGALATLMNTRGLTELIILSVGLQLGVLDPALYSLMVVMAVITTAMAGPLLRLLYPPSFIERDLANTRPTARSVDSPL